MGEKELVVKAQEGNKHAMNVLLQNNYKALFGFTLKMTASMHLTEDIVQEVCLRAVSYTHLILKIIRFGAY